MRSAQSMVMVVMMNLASCDELGDRVLVAGCMALQFAAAADTLIRLDMRTGGHLLQKDLDRFRALGAFETQKADGLIGHECFLETVGS
jgi:hypothetical protein